MASRLCFVASTWHELWRFFFSGLFHSGESDRCTRSIKWCVMQFQEESRWFFQQKLLQPAEHAPFFLFQAEYLQQQEKFKPPTWAPTASWTTPPWAAEKEKTSQLRKRQLHKLPAEQRDSQLSKGELGTRENFSAWRLSQYFNFLSELKEFQTPTAEQEGTSNSQLKEELPQEVRIVLSCHGGR